MMKKRIRRKKRKTRRTDLMEYYNKITHNKISSSYYSCIYVISKLRVPSPREKEIYRCRKERDRLGKENRPTTYCNSSFGTSLRLNVF